MTRPRNHIVCLGETPYYHVTARCVRRSRKVYFEPFGYEGITVVSKPFFSGI